jgi:Fur family peroxide stress response transcriptional regulator
MTNDISKHLISNGIKPSFQRIKVYEYLVKNRNHPTVDMIYTELVKVIPTFSKTTVYNTLELFMEKGLAIMLTIDEKETRYDADISVHTHFKCTQCSGIYDLKTDMNMINIPGLKEHKITEHHLYFKGICKSCLTAPPVSTH